MINFGRLSKYILAYIILMILSAFIAIGSIIRPIDLAVYQNFHLQSFSNYGKQLNKNKYAEIQKEINSKIIFIDIPTTEDNDWLFKFRSDIASLLKIIDSKVESIKESERPSIILDIAFRSDTTGLAQLESALFPLLIEKKMNVYAAYLMPENKK